jgi:hypothetical protein
MTIVEYWRAEDCVLRSVPPLDFMLGGASLAALWVPKRQSMGLIRSYAILQLKLLWCSGIGLLFAITGF